MATDYGSDVSTFPGLDWRTISGPRVVGEAVARRLMTPRGTLPFAPDYGHDVRLYLCEARTPLRIEQMRAAIEAEAERDERVESAEASITPLSHERVRIAVRLVLADGPLDLVLAVSALSIEILES